MALYSQKASGEAWIFLHNKFSVKSKKMYKRDFQKINLPMKVCLQYFIPYTLESGNKVSVITRHSQQFTWALYFFVTCLDRMAYISFPNLQNSWKKGFPQAVYYCFLKLSCMFIPASITAQVRTSPCISWHQSARQRRNTISISQMSSYGREKLIDLSVITWELCSTTQNLTSPSRALNNSSLNPASSGYKYPNLPGIPICFCDFSACPWINNNI